MTKDKQPAIFFAGDKEKEKAIEVCGKIIEIIEAETDDVLFKSYIMQMLLESFEEEFNVDIRNGMSFSQSLKKTNVGEDGIV